jgi:hypothetical protein
MLGMLQLGGADTMRSYNPDVKQDRGNEEIDLHKLCFLFHVFYFLHKRVLSQHVVTFIGLRAIDFF